MPPPTDRLSRRRTALRWIPLAAIATLAAEASAPVPDEVAGAEFLERGVLEVAGGRAEVVVLPYGRQPVWVAEGSGTFGLWESRGRSFYNHPATKSHLLVTAAADGRYTARRIGGFPDPHYKPITVTPGTGVVLITGFNRWTETQENLVETSPGVTVRVALTTDGPCALFRMDEETGRLSHVTTRARRVWVGAPLARRRTDLPPGAIFQGRAVAGAGRRSGAHPRQPGGVRR